MPKDEFRARLEIELLHLLRANSEIQTVIRQIASESITGAIRQGFTTVQDQIRSLDDRVSQLEESQ